MFAALTTEENNQLFAVLHRGYRRSDRYLSALIDGDAIDRVYRPALGVTQEIVALLGDLEAAEAAGERLPVRPRPAWIRCTGEPGCRCDEHSAPEPTGSRGPR